MASSTGSAALVHNRLPTFRRLTCLHQQGLMWRADTYWSPVRPRRNVDLADHVIMGLKEIGCELVDWIKLTQDIVQWWVLVNTAIDRLVYIQWEISSATKKLQTSENTPWTVQYYILYILYIVAYRQKGGISDSEWTSITRRRLRVSPYP
jgi:hypothetical protein